MSDQKFDFSTNAISEPCIAASRPRLGRAPLWLPAVSLFAGLTFYACLQTAYGQDKSGVIPFKFTNVHVETNSSACDMGIQILFDTEGVTSLKLEQPDGRAIYNVRTSRGFAKNGGFTEEFLEAVEPQVSDLALANPDCELDPEETISLEELQKRHPPGVYEFEGKSVDGVKSAGTAELTYVLPAGPSILAPTDGDNTVDPGTPLAINWEPVTTSLLPGLGTDGGDTVNVVGYHLVIKKLDGSMGPQVSPQLDIDVPADVTSIQVPDAYLEPSTIYEFEVLATEEGGNQTITEGLVFCTTDSGGSNPIDPCDVP
ncbi:MAG: fibronectin type III domain-containing protein [Alphaproteobacteria bacterium]